MTTFDALGVSPRLVTALQTAGITTPLPIQALTIADALAGRDVCGKAKTGSGKTLAFGLPLLMKVPKAKPGRPTGLILVPTRELAVQVRDVLVPLGQAADRSVTAVFGGTPMDRQINAVRKGYDVVVATPGRLIDLCQRGDITVADVAVLVLDEADRMADMGFMPQVVWLLDRIAGEHQTMLFSATLDSEIDRLVRNYTSDPVRHEVESVLPTVEQMEHRFLKVHELDKVKVAAAIAKGAGRTLFFSRTKRGADRLELQLRREGVKAGVLHGDLAQNARLRALKNFREDGLGVLVATDVAARGLDVDGIDVVVHYDPPEDHTAYIHRSGRTARAGATGVAVSLLLWDQLVESERLRRRLGIRQPVVELFSNDARLSDLLSAEWSSLPDEATGTDGAGDVVTGSTITATQARTRTLRTMGARRRRR
ncbi:MAG TPA: DEAD/DEAH box helicase [Acidimicrobiales bacterium]